MNPKADLIKREEELIEEFSLFDDWMGRYEYLIEMGKSIKPLPDAMKTDENKIHGCQSQVWIHGRREEGLVFYEGDSDALITKGLVALLLRVFSGLPALDVASADLSFIDKIGLREHLSPTRSNGLAGMISRIKNFATSSVSTKGN